MGQQKLSRRDFLKRLSVAAATGAIAAACAPAAPQIVEKVVKETVIVEKEVVKEVPLRPEKVELVGWTVHYMDPENEAYDAHRELVMGHFNAKYPDATFKHMDMGWDEVLRQNLVTALLGGTGPDIIVGENFIQPYAEIGAFLPMDDALEDIKDNLVEGTHAAAKLKGKMYGVSHLTGCFGFERNPNVIEKAGLDPDNPPKSWNELIEQAAAITRAGDGEYYGYTLQGPVGFLIGGILRFAVYHKVAKAELCKDECTYPWFDNPGSERVLAFMRELHKHTPPGLAFNPDEGQVYTQLFKGISAYQICGSWHIKWAKDSGLENARYSYIPIPDKDGVDATGVVGNVILSVMSGTKHPEEALYFCRCCLEDDVQAQVAKLGRLPSTRSGLKKFDEIADEGTKMFIDLLLNADLGVLPQWRKDPNKIWTAYNDLITKLLTTELPIKQLMDEAQATADQVMQEG